MNDFSGKKLLILGGAFQHCKLVEAAREMGVITYVVDYLPVEKAPAKQMSDYHYEYNITDYDEIVELCKQEHIDGVISAYFDACQIPYQKICDSLGVPCFGNEEQFHILTNKSAFIKKCIETGMDIIPQYQEKDFLDVEERKVEYPVIVKPIDSRGSRGQVICHSFDEVNEAIKFSKSESKSEKVIIERFLSREMGAVDLQLVYFIINGEPILLRVEDRFTGELGNGLDRLCVATLSPSAVQEKYIKNVTNSVTSFVKSLGLKNAPLFLQGFMDENRCRFYDPGLRLPGNDYDDIFYKSTGISIPEILIKFALLGTVESADADRIKKSSQKKITSMLFPTLKGGIIACIKGIDQIKNNENVVNISTLRKEGDEIKETHDLRQRFCEIDILCDTISSLKETIQWIQEVLTVQDINGNNMLCEQFDIDRLSIGGRY